MYVPHYEAILRALGKDRKSIEGADDITIPISLFKLLLQLALANGDFSEEAYLRANPDVNEAIERGDLPSGYVHYLGHGYFEGRRGGTPQVDEDWYLGTYPDVAAAVGSGRVSSAAAHFDGAGAAEGRSPSPDHEDDAAQWKQALRLP
jgi:hypothetical protein